MWRVYSRRQKHGGMLSDPGSSKRLEAMTHNAFRTSLLRFVFAFIVLVAVGVLLNGCGSSPSSTTEPDSPLTLPAQSTPTSAYPQLKTFYYGTYIEYDQYTSAPGEFHIWVSSEDDQGNVSIEAYFDYSTHHCSGNVTTDGQLTLHCNYISIGGQSHTSTFHGSISSGGHITGTETADDGSDNLKWDVS